MGMPCGEEQWALYQYNAEDENNIIRARNDGSLSTDGKCLNDQEISSLQLSSRWKQRYDRFLRKEIVATQGLDLAKNRLLNWIAEFSNKEDDEGKFVFSLSTIKTANKQLNKLEHVADVIPLDQVYTKVPPGPRSKHGLPTYKSGRPENSM
jgi:hypothetical protein